MNRGLTNYLLPGVCLLMVVSMGMSQTLQRRPVVNEYRLGAGDQVILHVTDLDEVTDRPIRIDPSGNIDVPLAGAVHADGLTISELKQELSKRLAKYITNPEISVNITENQSRPISVYGSVNHAGVYQLQGPKRLLEVISLAGGTSSDAGNTIVVTRQARWGRVEAPGVTTDMNGEYSSVSLAMDDLVSGKKPADNILIEPNDTVSVPKAELIFVVGSVKKPGGFALTRHDTASVVEALSLAEGLSTDASASHARILRRPEGAGPLKEIPVNADKILKGKEPDVAMRASDVLFVPNSNLKQGARIALSAAIGVTTGLVIYRH